MKIRFWTALGLLHFATTLPFISQPVFADTTESESGWTFSLGIGAGVRTNPVMDNKCPPLILIPQINYQGEHFFIQNLDVGYTFYDEQNQQLNMLITPSYDQLFFNRWDADNFLSETASVGDIRIDSPTVSSENKYINKNNLHERRMAALAGLEYRGANQTLEYQLQLLHEITGYYSGDEIRLALSKNIQSGKNDIKLTLGVNWQSDKTLNYFYGLPENEQPQGIAYHPRAGFSPLLRLDWDYQISQAWSFHFFSSYRHLSESITQSPLVVKDNVVTVFAGGVYHF